jgi:hypothetical protein
MHLELQTNVPISEKSLFNVGLTELWAIQSELDLHLQKMRKEVEKSGNSGLLDLGEKIETSSLGLKVGNLI